MDNICLYTIVHPISGIKDYTCQSDYAEQKSKQGYLIYADIIQKPIVYYPKSRVSK